MMDRRRRRATKPTPIPRNEQPGTDRVSAHLRFTATGIQLRRFGATFLVLMAVFLAGCLGPMRNDYQSVQSLSFSANSHESDMLWTAIQDTLRQHRFTLDRVDRRMGVITTMPVTSQHWFEFWRHDVDTDADFWEATVNPLRRWVEVTIATQKQHHDAQLSIIVHKERFSAPDRQFNSSGAAFEFFGVSLPETTSGERIAAEKDKWVSVGQDPAMQDYLRRKSLERLQSMKDAREPE